MPPPKPKAPQPKKSPKAKPKDAKAKKKEQLLKKQEEERRIQEELARQAEEEAKRLQEEQQRREEEERKRAYETETRQAQQIELSKIVHQLSEMNHLEKVADWERKRWDDYMNKATDKDMLQLPSVNAFISHWDDNTEHKIDAIWSKSRECLQIVAEIYEALYTYPGNDAKTRSQWLESIANLKDAVKRKISEQSMVILKNAKLYLSDKTQNMEFVYREGKIGLCLWANVHKAVRYTGMEMSKYKLEVHETISEFNCAVRILQLEFDPPYVRTHPADVSEQEECDLEAEFNDQMKQELEKDSQADAFIKETSSQESNSSSTQITKENRKEEASSETSENTENSIKSSSSKTSDVGETQGEQNDKNRENTEEHKVEKNNAQPEQEESTVSENDTVTDDDENESANIDKTESHKFSLPSRDTDFLLMEQYILLGGLCQVELMEIPKLTKHKKDATFIYVESLEPKLLHIDVNNPSKEGNAPGKHDSKIKSHNQSLSNEKAGIPSQQRTSSMKNNDGKDSNPETETKTLGKSENEEQENKAAIKVSIPIPKDVIILENPEVGQLMSDQNVFTSKGILNIDYSEESKEICFESSQFGKFGIFQRRYINMPYKDWEIMGGETIQFLMTGRYVTVVIDVSGKGCRLKSISPEMTFIKAKFSSSWITMDLLIEELLSAGINIRWYRNNRKFSGIPPKKRDIELDTYNSIALLSQRYEFRRSKWNFLQPAWKIIVQFRERHQDNAEYSLAMVTHDRAFLLQNKEDMEAFSDEAVESETYRSTLYHLLLNAEDDGKVEETSSDNSNCVVNARLLLQLTGVLSCS